MNTYIAIVVFHFSNYRVFKFFHHQLSEVEGCFHARDVREQFGKGGSIFIITTYILLVQECLLLTAVVYLTFDACPLIGVR